MTPNEQKMWHEISETITPYCVDGAGYILGFHEDPNCLGFSFVQNHGSVYIKALGCPGDGEDFPIEEDFRIYQELKKIEGKGYYDSKTLNWVEPPGMFEGLPIDAEA